MKIEFNDPLFLPHCGCQLELIIGPGHGHLLTGENGIGKSTLLSRIHLLYGHDLSLFLVQKELDFFADRSLKKLKALFLESELKALDRNLFERLWELFQLNLIEDRSLSQLSGGENQALKICLTLCKKSELYLLDEPFQFLDQARQEKLLGFLHELIKDSKLVILVEHQRELPLAFWRPIKLELQEGVLKLVETWKS